MNKFTIKLCIRIDSNLNYYYSRVIVYEMWLEYLISDTRITVVGSYYSPGHGCTDYQNLACATCDQMSKSKFMHISDVQSKVSLHLGKYYYLSNEVPLTKYDAQFYDTHTHIIFVISKCYKL
jgi:hypothetical protein